MSMYSPTPARPRASSKQGRIRPPSLRTQLMARGPGWRLAEGEGQRWHVKLRPECDDLVRTWAHMLRTIRGLSNTHSLRPITIDLREVGRLRGPAAEAAGLLFAEFESRGLRVSAIVGPDLIHIARVHRLMAFHAPTCGRGFVSEQDAVAWVRGGVGATPRPAQPAPPIRRRSNSVSPPRV